MHAFKLVKPFFQPGLVLVAGQCLPGANGGIGGYQGKDPVNPPLAGQPFFVFLTV
jgi:hypothetical protein